jgi:hypothetical protein
VDCAKSSTMSHIVVDRTQVGAIEHIQEVKPELQVSLLSYHWKTIIFQYTSIYLC